MGVKSNKEDWTGEDAVRSLCGEVEAGDGQVVNSGGPTQPRFGDLAANVRC